MADTRYLKRRRQGWYFYLAVPVDLQAKLGKKHIIESLGTRDLSKAQKGRWPKLAEWMEAFERRRGNLALTNAEIEEHAQRVFYEFLGHLQAVYGDAVEAEKAQQRDELTLQLDLFADAANGLPGKMDPAVANEISKIEARTGALIDRHSPTYGRLARAITQALYHAVQGRLAALDHKQYEIPTTFGGLQAIDPLTLRPVKLAKVPRRQPGASITFSEAAQRFLEELQRDQAAKKTEQTIAQHEAVYRLFTQFVGDAPMEDISEERCSEFMQEVARLDPHWGRSPETKKLTVWQIIDRFGHGEEHLSNRTLNRYLSSLRAVWKWAKRRKLYKGPDPFADQFFERPPAKQTMWRLYTDEELQRLMGSPLLKVPRLERIRPKRHDMNSALRWIPLLALFTGMRQGELCQLHTADLMQEGGYWIFRVHADRDGFRLKTEAAERTVPIHSELIRCGLLDYLRALPDGLLFPALKPGGPDGKLNSYFSKRFTEYRRKVGITRPRVVFHSLRKNAAQALKDGGATPNQIAELIGHERGFTVETYAPNGLPVPVLKELIERIEYSHLDLSHLEGGHARAAQFADMPAISERVE